MAIPGARHAQIRLRQQQDITLVQVGMVPKRCDLRLQVNTALEVPRTDAIARSFERLGRILVAGGLIRQAAPYEALVDNAFAEVAVRALGAERS